MRMLSPALLIAVVVIIFGLADQAHACSCARPDKSPGEIAKAGGIVVEGVAVSENISAQQNGVVSYRFKVSRAVNIKAPRVITLWSQASSTACGARLEVGAVSVVALHGKKPKGYWFNSCGQWSIHHDIAGWKAILRKVP